MASSITHAQLKSFSDCLHRIYDEPAGENPINAILDALEGLVRVDTLAVDQMRGDGRGGTNGNETRLVRHSHLGSRGYAGHPLVARIPFLTSHDHPMIQHVLKRGFHPALKMSDFVSQRQLRNISLYEFNNKVQEWRDQAALVLPTSNGSISFALNRDQVFTKEEFLQLQLLQPHMQRVMNRCAYFVSLPGNEQLTPREREVLYWMMQGKRDEEIALLIQSKPGTVKKQVSCILLKLAVENRASAMSLVLTGMERP